MDADEFFWGRGFGRKLGFGTRPAVLSIDLLTGFTDEKMPLGANLDAEIANTRRILDVARSKNIPIFHTSVEYDNENLSDAGIWRLKQAGLSSLVAGTDAVTVDARIGRTDDEPVIVKKYASAFFGTDLASRLVSLQIDTVLITGATTSGCVRASAVDAVQNGFRPIVVNDAVGDRSQAAHFQSLFDLEQKYADVVSMEDVVKYINESVLEGTK